MTDERDNAVWRRGWFVITLAFGVAGAAVWFAYDVMMAPRWMRAFAEELASRATVVSTSAPDTAFSTMKGREDPDSPFICISELTDFDWDRLYVVQSGGPVQPALEAMSWARDSARTMNARLARDPRYQLIVFTRGGEVTAFDYYFTMWGDLSAVARPQGFDPMSAVFVAESNGGSYTVLQADVDADTACAPDRN